MIDATELLERPAQKKKARAARVAERKAKARADKAGKAEKTPKTDLAEKRAQKRKRVAEANTFTVILDTEVRKRIASEARAAGMDMVPYLQKVLDHHVLTSAEPGDALAARIAARRAVHDRIVSLARELDDGGAFDEHFVLTVLRKASEDPEFLGQYEAAIDAKSADDRALARAQAPVNQQMGRLIKRAAGARSKRDAKGKILRAQVQGELISTYTLLEKPA